MYRQLALIRSEETEGLIETTEDPLILTGIGVVLILVAALLHFITQRLGDNEDNFAGSIMGFAALLLLFGGIFALFKGLFGG